MSCNHSKLSLRPDGLYSCDDCNELLKVVIRKADKREGVIEIKPEKKTEANLPRFKTVRSPFGVSTLPDDEANALQSTDFKNGDRVKTIGYSMQGCETEDLDPIGKDLEGIVMYVDWRSVCVKFNETMPDLGYDRLWFLKKNVVKIMDPAPNVEVTETSHTLASTDSSTAATSSSDKVGKKDGKAEFPHQIDTSNVLADGSEIHVGQPWLSDAKGNAIQTVPETMMDELMGPPTDDELKKYSVENLPKLMQAKMTPKLDGSPRRIYKLTEAIDKHEKALKAKSEKTDDDGKQ